MLLFVHGGPGSPEMPLTTNNAELERRFVVVNWDQRGAGKSYDPAVFNETFTVETFVEDAATLSRMLAKRFNQPKIYLMGHSWGTFLGVKTVQKYPERFHAYLGIGQVANQLEGERASYDWTLAQARRRGDAANVEKLLAYGRPGAWSAARWSEYIVAQRGMVADYGGSLHRGDFYPFVVKALVNCREYTVSDKVHFLVGAQKSSDRLWETIVGTDLNRVTPRLAVPVYVFQGRHDYQTPHAVAWRYFDGLDAPRKRFFTFEQSAHSPIFEEPARFVACLDSAVREAAVPPVVVARR